MSRAVAVKQEEKKNVLPSLSLSLYRASTTTAGNARENRWARHARSHHRRKAPRVRRLDRSDQARHSNSILRVSQQRPKGINAKRDKPASGSHTHNPPPPLPPHAQPTHTHAQTTHTWTMSLSKSSVCVAWSISRKCHGAVRFCRCHSETSKFCGRRKVECQVVVQAIDLDQKCSASISKDEARAQPVQRNWWVVN